MFCKDCGSEVFEGSRFCGKCGGAIAGTAGGAGHLPPASAPQGEQGVRSQAAALDAALRGSEVRAAARGEAAVADFYKKSLIKCLVVGIVAAIVLGTSGTTAPGALAGIGFLAPFGFAPMMRWLSGHTFVVWLNWIFVLCAFALAVCTALVVGPLYIAYAVYKIVTCSLRASSYEEAAQGCAA